MGIFILAAGLTSLLGLRSFRTARRAGLIVLTSALVTITFNDKLLEVGDVQGVSMQPSLSPDYATTGERDYLAWRKWQPASTSDLCRGDVVMFANPLRPEAVAVKRVVALEGDTVILDRRRRPAEEFEGASWDSWGGKARVPYGHVWVEGDNWRASKDSNYYGPVSRSLIVGKALRVLWPWGRARDGGRPWEGFEVKTRVVEGREGREVPAMWAD